MLHRFQSFSTIGWGVFCASSWTWCIGMFLPLIMLTRYGWPGFFVFAIPNVLGCALFGYVVATPGRSLALIDRHPAAMRWFSLITLAYHVFFLGTVCLLMLPMDEPPIWAAIFAPLVAYGLALTLSGLSIVAWPWFAALTYLVSIGVFVSIGTSSYGHVPPASPLALEQLAWLAPTIAFGFLLCPYLDLTFHRALQSSPSRHTFAVFGVTFFVMILLTCAYWQSNQVRLGPLVLGHLFGQSVFTMSAHIHELRRKEWTFPALVRRMQFSGAQFAVPVLALPVAFVPMMWTDSYAHAIDMYLRFLVFYGLLFPAYVLIMMKRDAGAPQRIVQVAAVAVVVGALPLYEYGYLHGQPWLLPIPLAMLLAIAAWNRFRRNSTVASIEDVS